MNVRICLRTQTWMLAYIFNYFGECTYCCVYLSCGAVVQWVFVRWMLNIAYEYERLLLRLIGDQSNICIYFCTDMYIVIHYKAIQSSAVITRPSIVRYWINDYGNWGRISNRYLNGRAMECPLWFLWENWPRYNGTVQYTYTCLHWYVHSHSLHC